MKENPKPRLLIIDDEANMRHMLYSMLKNEYDMELAESGSSGLDTIRRKSGSDDGSCFDFILCDIRMPEMDGLEFLDHAREIAADTPIIVMSAYGTIDIAIEAMKKGAYDYISKPFRKDELVLVMKKAMEREALKKENSFLKKQLGRLNDEALFPGMIGKSKAMARVFFLAGKAAESDVSVLLTGESGTGKELVAKGIHLKSSRSAKELTSVNCGALPENLIESELFGHVKGAFTGAAQEKKGLFAVADGGTLFLDEIGELPVNLQVKLLRVLQEGEIRPIGSVKSVRVDVRVIAATSRNLQAEISKGLFREDLFYRLNVLNINIPPLRERVEDIPHLALHFISKSSEKIRSSKCSGITPEAMDLLCSYSWPGNVRELENMIERSVLLAENERLIPDDFHGISKESVNMVHVSECINLIGDLSFSIKDAHKKIEAYLIKKALEQSSGNRTHAAKLLEISHPSLLMKIKMYNINE